MTSPLDTRSHVVLLHLATFVAGVAALLWAGPLHAQSAGGSPGSGAGGRAGPVVVSGVVPDEATRQTILGQVREIYCRERVVDQLGVAPTEAPPNWADYVKKLVTPELRNIQHGHLKVTGNTVELVGDTDSAATRDRIGSTMNASLNPTYTVNNRLQVGEAPQARIDNILVNKIVEFESGSAVLSPVGQQVMDELIPVLGTLDGSKKIHVVGHTDASGERQANVALSHARAVAVKNYLVAHDFQPTNILTVGMGPDQPISENGTPEGRAKNRRIEFRIQP
jgi:OmpA-OmpF porin, OOP family